MVLEGKHGTHPQARTNDVSLEEWFRPFAEQIIGKDQEFLSPYGKKKIIYADWTASGRLYQSIEDKMLHEIGPYVANTHTETSITGACMTQAYHEAREIIKQHVHAGADDVLISVGSGMTGAVNKFQRILGFKVSESLSAFSDVPKLLKPIVFVSHMEHHSNQISWMETIADVEVVPCNEEGLICMDQFEQMIRKYEDRKIKIASITAASNVTGIKTNYHAVAKLIHSYDGLCFVDFACSAPYVKIDMHPKDPQASLDAIFFSPHKFLGGPGSSGILVFNKKLYSNHIPDNPGGGTVTFTNPWGGRYYISDIEVREDGGTPAFLQTIRVALAMKLKDQMGVKNIHEREAEINKIMFERLSRMKGVQIFAGKHKNRLSIFSFQVTNIHYNLVAKLLNDRYGIQSRGGCSCAGTYGHYLFEIDQENSRSLREEIEAGVLTKKPGWIRISLHPTFSNKEVEYICDALEDIIRHHKEWAKDYTYNLLSNDFDFKGEHETMDEVVSSWFAI
ncbi:MAG: aminotransferase class V-fold PLP-dependent enzyme [Bacteroidota bacterium]